MRLLIAFVIVVAAGWGVTRVRDWYLMRSVWPALSADAGGLTVSGTLDGRSYDRNMFQVVTVSDASRVELTDRGWSDIFNGRGGRLFDTATGDAIQHAISVDGRTGYALLLPFVRFAVAEATGRASKELEPRPDMLISVPSNRSASAAMVQRPLAEVLARFAGSHPDAGDAQDTADASGSGTGGHDVEHGLTLPPDVVRDACPTVLTTSLFTDASLEEHPGSILQHATYEAHLGLTDEGRSRFYQWSRDHPQENVVFILNHRIVAAARVAEPLAVSSLDIGPLHDKAAADELVRFINESAKHRGS